MAIRSLEYGSNAFVSVEELNNQTGNFTVDRSKRRTGSSNRGTRCGGDCQRYLNACERAEACHQHHGFEGEHDLGGGPFGSGAIPTPAGVSGVGTSTFAITDGGALFQLGPQVNTNLQENIGVQTLQANRLGNSLVGFLSDLKDGQRFALSQEKFKEASDVVDEVITQISMLRGRLGAFERNTLQPNINQLQITSENLTASQAVIRDTDFAEETSELTRSQILVQAGNSILAIANAQSQKRLAIARWLVDVKPGKSKHRIRVVRPARSHRPSFLHSTAWNCLRISNRPVGRFVDGQGHITSCPEIVGGRRTHAKAVRPHPREHPR